MASSYPDETNIAGGKSAGRRHVGYKYEPNDPNETFHHLTTADPSITRWQGLSSCNTNRCQHTWNSAVLERAPICPDESGKPVLVRPNPATRPVGIWTKARGDTEPDPSDRSHMLRRLTQPHGTTHCRALYAKRRSNTSRRAFDLGSSPRTM